MILNASKWNNHTLTIVMDGLLPLTSHGEKADTVILNWNPQGASASRNIGAGSIPKYRRQKFVMFCDDDCYFCPGWDRILQDYLVNLKYTIVSGHQHPYNQAKRTSQRFYRAPIMGFGFNVEIDVPLVLSTVHMVMPWEIFDDCGPWDEPGGPGGSEDYAFCMRAKALCYKFAVTVPMCVLHTGLSSSSGKQIVGYEEMVTQNESLIKQYGLEGKVIWK